MCGIAKPINAIGPANAVIVPASKLVEIIIANRLLFIFKPRLRTQHLFKEKKVAR